MWSRLIRIQPRSENGYAAVNYKIVLVLSFKKHVLFLEELIVGICVRTIECLLELITKHICI